jgi:hypothetical protein
MIAEERDGLRSEVASLTSECESVTAALKAVEEDNEALRLSSRQDQVRENRR